MLYMQLLPGAIVLEIAPSSSARKPKRSRSRLFSLPELASGISSINEPRMPMKGMLYENGLTH